MWLRPSRLVLVVAILCAAALAPADPSPTVRELQMNLCHSGEANCYQGARTTAEAAGLITRYRPFVVTLSEICAADILSADSPLRIAMAGIGGPVFAVFAPAVHRGTGRPFRCTDGDQYGIGIIGHGALLGTTRHYLYQHQYTISPEERVAVCAETDGYDVCTSHLESDNPGVAVNQCHELMSTDVPDFRNATGQPPTVVAGDFNLVGIGFCVPSGWAASSDGIVQHVLSNGLRPVAIRTVHMRYTDHPALIVDLG